MSEPERWVDGEGPGRTLVASMQGEALSEEAKRRLRSSLGIGVGVAGLALAAKANAAKGTVAAASAKGTAGVAIAKWMGIGALAATAAVGSVAATQLAADRAPPIASAPLRASASASDPTETAREPLTAPASTEPTREPPEQAAIPSEPAPFAKPAPVATAAQVRKATLTEELKLLETARRALHSRDATGAREALERYRATVPHGVLAVEAEALDIEALAASGRTEEAAARANTFLARYGEGPLAERVRRLVAPEAR